MLLQIGIPAPMVFFFEEEKFIVLQEIGGGKSAHSSADDGDIIATRNPRAREPVAVTHLVADIVVFAVDVCPVSRRDGQQQFVQRTAGNHRPSHYELNEIPASVLHVLVPSERGRDHFGGLRS